MKTTQKGFVVPVIVAVVALAAGVLYMYTKYNHESLLSAPIEQETEVGVTDLHDRLPAAAFSDQAKVALAADTAYANSTYGFSFKYPKDSVFANAQPDYGSVVRFFFPGGKNIRGDEENIAVLISKKSADVDTVLGNLKYNFSQNGPVDVKEVTFGGQKGYRIVLTSNYTASKGTKELFYITVKNGTLYNMNYFPVVEKSLPLVDSIAASFKFTK